MHPTLDIKMIQHFYKADLLKAIEPDARFQTNISAYTTRLIGPELDFYHNACWLHEDPPIDMKSLAQSEMAFFLSQGRAFEWKHFDFLGGDVFADILEHLGGVKRDWETIMVAPVDIEIPMPAIRHVEVRQLFTKEEFSWISSVQEKVWSGELFSWLVERLHTERTNPKIQVAIFCAFDTRSNEPLGTGWVRRYGRFAMLHGGAVSPQARGRGIYKSLLLARKKWAQSQELKYLLSDCTAASFPILDRLKFTKLARTCPMIFKP